ncbi:hypothetical protein CBL_03266 [Carabus blaptoides fortunei]
MSLRRPAASYVTSRRPASLAPATEGDAYEFCAVGRMQGDGWFSALFMRATGPDTGTEKKLEIEPDFRLAFVPKWKPCAHVIQPQAIKRFEIKTKLSHESPRVRQILSMRWNYSPVLAKPEPAFVRTDGS